VTTNFGTNTVDVADVVATAAFDVTVALTGVVDVGDAVFFDVVATAAFVLTVATVIVHFAFTRLLMLLLLLLLL
jgi:hypothetical protein